MATPTFEQLATAVAERLRARAALRGRPIFVERPGDPVQRLEVALAGAQSLAIIVEMPRLRRLTEAGREIFLIPVRIRESALGDADAVAHGSAMQAVRKALLGWTPPGFPTGLTPDPDEPQIVLFKDRARSRNTEILNLNVEAP